MENIYDADDFSYDFEYEDKYEFLGDFHEVNTAVVNLCDNYIDNPDEMFPKLIEVDNLELLKDKINLANFFLKYRVYLNYDRKEMYLFYIAKHINKTILQWFKTYNFQKWFIEEYESDIAKGSDKYRLLKSSEIIEPKIQSDYEYLVDSEKYNL